MDEVSITTNKANHLVDPVLEIWGHEVAVYLFLGGLTAGILIIGASVHLLGKGRDYPWAAGPLLLLGPILLSLGMVGLFLDLEHKAHVFRFYTAFDITSPMSWGSWILLLVYPLSAMMILATWREHAPRVAAGVQARVPARLWNALATASEWCHARLPRIAALTLPVGIALGIYTGILLSAYTARPFWNHAVMGPLFLASGISTALALTMAFTPSEREHHIMSRLDLAAIAVELVLLFLFGYSMFTSTESHQQAIAIITGGELTALFWIPFVGLGLLFPLALEIIELRGARSPRWLVPALVLCGGFIFRVVMLEAGQRSTWIIY